MSDLKFRMRVWVKPCFGGLYWKSTNPDQVTGLYEFPRNHRALTREVAVQKCIRAYKPKADPWEEVIYEQ